MARLTELPAFTRPEGDELIKFRERVGRLEKNDAGRCALVVFPEKDICDKVKEGDRIEIIGNVVFIREPYGLVVKKSELL